MTIPFVQKSRFAAIAIATALLSIPVVTRALFGIDDYHDGLSFKAAFDIATGQVLPGAEYSQYGPLFNGVNGLILWLSGYHFVSLKLWTAALYVVSFVLVYVATARVSNPIVGLFAMLTYLMLFPFLEGPLLVWASTAVMPLTLVLALLLVFALEHRRRASAYAAGAVVAAIVFIKINVGMTLTVGLAGATTIVLLGARGRDSVTDFSVTMKRVFIGLLVAVSVMFAYLGSIGALASWFYQNVTLPAAMSDFVPNVWYNRPNDFDFLFSRLFPLGMGAVWLIIPVLVLVGSVGLVFAALAGCTGPILRVGLVLAAISGASWAQYYPVVDLMHGFWSVMPMLPFLGFMAWWMVLCLARLFGIEDRSFRTVLKGPFPQIATAVAVVAVEGLWLFGNWTTVGVRSADMRPIEISRLALLHESAARATDLEQLDKAITEYGSRHGPVRLLNLTMNALPNVLVPNPANWSRVPVLYALYTEGDAEQSLALAKALSSPEKADDPRLIYSNGYGYFVPPFHPIASTSEGGLLLAPGSSKELSDLPGLAEAGLGCGRIELHSALVSPQYLNDRRRFWGYFMPPIRAAGPVQIDVLVARRKAEGPNSVLIDAHIQESSPAGFSIRRFAERGEKYFLTEWIDGRPEPLIGLNLTAEVIHHIQLRHGQGRWNVYVDGARVGIVPSRLASLRSDRAIRLGAGHRYIDSFVGEIIDWRVVDLSACSSAMDLPPPVPDIAVRANGKGSRFAASLNR